MPENKATKTQIKEKKKCYEQRDAWLEGRWHGKASVVEGEDREEQQRKANGTADRL